jgi:hypothetical protein
VNQVVPDTQDRPMSEDHATKTAIGRVVGDTDKATGYLVGPACMITCYHAVRQQKTAIVYLNGETLSARVIFPDHTEIAAAEEADIAVLELERPTTAKSLVVATYTRKRHWNTYGFPSIGEGALLPLEGKVLDWDALDTKGRKAIILYSHQVAAGMAARISGFSGSPVLIDGFVIGHLKRVLSENENPGRPALGMLFATPAALIAQLAKLSMPIIPARRDPSSTYDLRTAAARSIISQELQRTCEQTIERLAANALPLTGNLLPETPPAVIPDSVNEWTVQQTLKTTIRQISGTRFGQVQVDAHLALLDRRSKVIRNLASQLRRSKEPCVLLGDPGSGKTHLLAHVASRMVEREKHKPNPSLILYFRAGSYSSEYPATKSGLEFALSENLLSRDLDLLSALIRAGRAVFLIDGLDEMPRADYHDRVAAISTFAKTVHLQGNRCLMSCRIDDLSPHCPRRRLVIAPLRRQQIQRYLEVILKSPSAQIRPERLDLKTLMWKVLRPDFIVDPSNPQSLALLAGHIFFNNAIPVDRGELLADFFRRTLKEKTGRQAEHPDSFNRFWDECSSVWANLAFLLSRSGDASEVRSDQLSERSHSNFAVPFQKVDVALAAGFKAGILITEGVQKKLRFSHHRYQEYFTARYIVDSRPPVNWDQIIDSQRWQEILLLVVSLGGLLPNIDNHLPEIPTASMWKELSLKREADLSDRIAFLVRISEAGRRRTEPVFEALSVRAERSVETAISCGNPATQLQMLRVFTRLKTAPISFLAPALATRNSTVAAQALVLRAEITRFVLDKPVSVFEDLLIELRSGTLPRRFSAYWKCARVCGSLKVYILALVAYGCLIPTALMAFISAKEIYQKVQGLADDIAPGSWAYDLLTGNWYPVFVVCSVLVTWALTWRSIDWRNVSAPALTLAMAAIPLLINSLGRGEGWRICALLATFGLSYVALLWYRAVLRMIEQMMFWVASGTLFLQPMRVVGHIRTSIAAFIPGCPLLVAGIFLFAANAAGAIAWTWSSDPEIPRHLAFKFLQKDIGDGMLLAVIILIPQVILFLGSVTLFLSVPPKSEYRSYPVLGAILLLLVSVFAPLFKDFRWVEISNLAGPAEMRNLFYRIFIVIIGLFGIAMILKVTRRAIIYFRRTTSASSLPRDLYSWEESISNATDPQSQCAIIARGLSMGTPEQLQEAMERIRPHIIKEAEDDFYKLWDQVRNAARQQKI